MACLEALLTIEHCPFPPATFSLVKVPVQHGPPAGALSQAPFYPTALKGCRGIVFTHSVRMDGRAGRQWEMVCPGCISETIRYRKLILGRDIG